jgi:hypothetical protein
MPHASVSAGAIKKISRRVVPLLAIGYLVSYLAASTSALPRWAWRRPSE